ncbi:hypothetical protein KQH65_12445 [archaeon]|nr:hypothetical protein [archaeon]
MATMNPIIQFEATVDAIYGVYLDSTTGFDKLRGWLEQQQQDSLRRFKESKPELATTEYLDSTLFIYGKGDPNKPDAVELHRCTQGQYKERNSQAGLNFLFIGNMVLVSIYQFWEDHFRAEVATYLNMDKNDLKESIMGDIRHLRRSIVHHAGIALPEVERCEILRWFNEGDVVYLDKEKFETVIYEIKRMVKGLMNRNENV